jgi:hypothetical protein
MARKFLNGIDVVGQLASAIGANLSSGKLLGRSTAGTGAIEEISVGSGLTLSAGTLTASGGTVTIGTSAADVLSIDGGGEITADDAAADKIVFWDDSASKLTYLTVGSNLTITDTTIAASGGGGGGTEPSNPFLLMGA